jgi:hypothetical protein
MKKRLFTFGCSFTNYIWPTWADFLSLSYNEYHNYGKSGGGNQFIFESLIEADITHKFTKNDTVVIMWSTYHRHDLYKDGYWNTPGNILNAEPLYDQAYLRKYFDIKGSVLHSLNYIRAAQELFNSRTNLHVSSMQSMTMPIGETTGKFTDLFRMFVDKSIFTEFPDLEKYKFIFGHEAWLPTSMMEFIQKYPPEAYNKTVYLDYPAVTDDHPTPKMHLDWCRAVGLQLNDVKAAELLIKWNKVWQGVPVHGKDGTLWCKENIRCTTGR